MTTEELMALLRDPDQTGQAVNELNRMIEEYSYFHTGHQLYLQGLKQTNELQLAGQLNQSALNVRDRGLLYNYINRPGLFRQQTTDPQGEAIPTPSKEEIVPPFAPGNAFVTPDTIIHSGSTEPDTEPPAPMEIGIGGAKKGPDDTYVLAEEKIMTNDELMAIIQRQLEQIGPPVVTGSTPVSGSTNDPVIPDVAININTGISSDIKDQPVDDQLSRVVELPVEQKQVITPAHQPETSSSNDLIESFLRANPKIIPSEEFNYQVDLTDSLQEDQDIATETLADIYVSQGHINKAVEIYEHLILKYPEKHIYFAAQINRLKQESNIK